MDASGAGPQNLTANSSAVDESPTWSVDNQWIAYSTSASGNLELFILKTDGSQQYNITLFQADDRDPSWQ
jgi:Tol biopolymer transport system component